MKQQKDKDLFDLLEDAKSIIEKYKGNFIGKDYKKAAMFLKEVNKFLDIEAEFDLDGPTRVKKK